MLHPTVVYLKVPLDDEIDFKAGQFVNFTVEVDGVKHTRAFSIASSPSSKKELEFAIRIVPDGELTPLIGKMKVGDKVILKGPLGRFTAVNAQKKNFVFGSTGTGITPIRSIIKDLFEKNTNKYITLIYGSRDQGGLLFSDEFEKLENENPNFKFVKVVSDDKTWKGKTGRITDYFDEIIDYKSSDVFLCGIPVMVESAHDLLLKKNMDESQIHFEKYVVRKK